MDGYVVETKEGRVKAVATWKVTTRPPVADQGKYQISSNNCFGQYSFLSLGLWQLVDCCSFFYIFMDFFLFHLKILQFKLNKSA